MSDNLVEIEAPAKINIFLAIRAKRPDGYHELQTVMQKLDLYDRLQLKKTASGISLKCSACCSPANRAAEILPADDRNIAYRAAQLYLEKGGVRGGVQVLLEKNIPIAAGLGGGSSDAAAVLLGLSKLYPCGFSREELMAMAASLGADVPFFMEMESGATFAEGVGDILHPISPLRNCRIVLVNPGFLVSTKWVYDNFTLTSYENPYTLGPELDSYVNSSWFNAMLPHLNGYGVKRLYNHLETVTIRKYPELSELKEQITAHGSELTMMSGSGPTLFGVFSEEQAAEKCFRHLKDRHDTAFNCRPLQ